MVLYVRGVCDGGRKSFHLLFESGSLTGLELVRRLAGQGILGIVLALSPGHWGRYVPLCLDFFFFFEKAWALGFGGGT